MASFLVAVFLAEGLLTVYRVVKHGKVGREEVIRVRRESRRVLGAQQLEMKIHKSSIPFGYTYARR
jgi:hypothetical protein